MGLYLSAKRFWETVRHLKPVQLIGRVRFRLFRPRPDLAPAPALGHRDGPWSFPAKRAPSLIASAEFLFLNQPGKLEEIGWDGEQREKLWRYNQHYFDDLNAADARHRTEWHRELIASWIRDNPPAIATAWDPYPTSLRIVNWIKWQLGGEALSRAMVHSLAIQARWLARRLEWHLLGNHLFANAKALLFAGCFFSGDEADQWWNIGADILREQISEQILADGGHFELSPMYHAIALEDMLDLANLLRAFPERGNAELRTEIDHRIPDMLAWLLAMSHPDGGISFFNDAAFGIAPSNVEILGYAERLDFAAVQLSTGITNLAQSGYVRLDRGAAVVLIDAARIGPDYLPGHAHADTLSFELSIGTQRVFVNSGTSEYGTGPERQRQRGTAAHNCVVVSGQNSSDVWAGFRVARRAYPAHVAVSSVGNELCVEADHDGYRTLHDRPCVSRRFALNAKELTIEDRVTPETASEAHYHLHPSVVVVSANEQHAVLSLADGTQFLVSAEGGALSIQSSSWHPEFGRCEPSKCLVLTLIGGKARLTSNWAR